MTEKKRITLRKKGDKEKPDLKHLAKEMYEKIEKSEEAGTIADPFQLAFDFGSFYDSSDQDDQT